MRPEFLDRIADLFVTGAHGDGAAVKVDAADGAVLVAFVPNATVDLASAA
ncbi:hypothetical protein BCL57_000209 [Agromyces flavus]|uniref:Uncharacterized protein n=1 Tax=Agromyces flavus TaxID=589382 RepID=A0ABT1KGQ9_9MICO|nr:hypothetical protein [Agromyces flavus]MCP2366067.1 hypothetical protein [Agromyces flavus]